MPILRDGQRTSSHLLDRIPYFDPRSRNFPITAEIAADAKPRSYTWALGAEVLDQGHEGSCVGHGVTHELMAKPVVVSGLDHAYAVELYFDAQRNDEWPGGSYPGGSPAYEGTSVLAGIQIAQARGHYSAYRWAFGLNDLILALGYAGPAVLGLHWYEGMFRADASGYVAPTGALKGGHCVTAIGVNIARQEFLLVNSWGPDWSTATWGKKYLPGHFKMTYASMDRLLQEGGEACIPTRVRV